MSSHQINRKLISLFLHEKNVEIFPKEHFPLTGNDSFFSAFTYSVGYPGMTFIMHAI